MNQLRYRTIAGLLLVYGAAVAAVPASTGTTTDGKTDAVYKLDSGPAFLVTTRPANWGSQPGAQWIGPAADAVNTHPASNGGNFIFTITFIVPDISKANLAMSVMASPDADLSLNGTFLPGGGNQGVSSPTKVNLTALVPGTNTLKMFVSDFGSGPVGLNIAFSGTLGGSTGPILSITPATSSASPLAFSQASGTSSSQTLTMTNTGDANLNITNIKLNGDLTGFSLDLTSCLGTTVSAGNSCKLPVTYFPGASTISTTPTITVTSNATPATQDIFLKGTVLAPSAAKIAVNPTQASFKDTVVGTNSEGGLIAVSNIGTAPLTISSISVNDPNFFLDTSTCVPKTPQALQPGGSCLLGVQFRPVKAGSLTGNVSFGSNASNTATLTLTGRALAPKTCIDTDGDFLCDFWETDGVHVTGADGSDQFIDLPAMGADPMYKDIFIHADWMADAKHDHKPKVAGMKQAQLSFRGATQVKNPNGQTGINLHIDCGPDCPMDGRSGKTWQLLSKSAKLPEVTPLSPKDGSDPLYDWSYFDKITGPFDNTGRKMIFHHVIFVHDQAKGTTSSGISRNDSSSVAAFSEGASDFIVSLGSWGDQDTDIAEGGTLMHELGHNLSLQHGGTNGLNYKPNYLSVMNYNFQSLGLIQAGHQGLLDYSSFELPSINENDMNELKGLNAFDKIPNYGTAWFCNSDDPSKVGPHTVLLANGWIDWNCDGYGADGSKARVQANINGDHNKAGQGFYDILTTQNDWINLRFNGGAIGGQVKAPPQLSKAIFGADITAEEAALKPVLNKVRVAAPAVVNLTPGASATVTLVLSNGGINPDSFALNVPAVPGWINAANVPASIDLNSGTSGNIPVTLSAPATAKSGDSQRVSLVATSKASPMVGSAEILIAVVATADPIAFSARTLDLGNLPLGTKSFASPLVVTNTGTAAIAITSVVATGDFTQTNNCGSSLATGATCVVQVTFTPTVAGSRSGSLTLTNSAAGSPHIITLKGIAQPKPPVIGAAVHAASATQGSFAPGTLISVFGTGLADKQEFITGIPLPTTLGGTTVTINDIPAPFTFAGPNQINIQVPYELTPGITGTIAVTASSGLSAYTGFDVVAASPGIFMIAGTQHAAAQNADFSINLSTSPTAPGGAVIMYFTGQGALDATVATGGPSPSSPLARTKLPATATVGGLPATVAFAGLTPGFAGLAQANIVVPANGADGKPLPAGDYPVILTIGGVLSNAANISVGK